MIQNWGYTQKEKFFISRRALAWEGDYEMMPVCACVGTCVCALVCDADFSKLLQLQIFVNYLS